MSKNFGIVKGFYNNRLWSIGMVRNAVSLWITAEEFLEITGIDYKL
jgi:hypothetical protein